MKKLCIILFLLFSNCESNSKKCIKSEVGKAVLVAYRVSKHSRLWLQNPVTKIIYEIQGLGGRREPNISLGDTIYVTYCDGDLILDKVLYVRYPNNRETRFIYLPGYSYLY